MKPVFKVLLMAIAYLATFVIGSLTGLIHPMCYAYVGALLPLPTPSLPTPPIGGPIPKAPLLQQLRRCLQVMTN